MKQYWDDYYSKVGKQGDYIDDLIESAKRRPYGRRGHLQVESGEYTGYSNGVIKFENSTKRWVIYRRVFAL